MSKAAAGQVMPIISVPSVDDIRGFYVEKLGFNHMMGVIGKDGQLDFCTVVLGGARLMFGRAMEAPAKAAPPTKPAVEIYLEVADVKEYHEALKAKGVKISDPLTVQWWGDETFKIVDPLGYVIWFYQSVGEPKPPQGTKIV
jgi:uncharacterized glyoxalase superfamily protein PhnB